MATDKKEYVLGTGADELERLGLQHRIWADATVAAWKRAGIGPGKRVLDLGCGPGFASFELAQLVTSKGSVLAVDESENFVGYLNDQSERRNIPQLRAKIADANNIDTSLASEEKFDAIYCRWVLCWLPTPAKTIAGMAKLLKPGGRIVLHDYFNWRAMSVGPRSKAVEKMVLAAVSSFEDRQGNVDIGSHLLKYIREAGLKTTHFDIHQRVARGGNHDSTWAWISSWWHTYGPKLVQIGKLSQSDCEQALIDIDEAEKNPDKFFFTPPLLEFIAEK
jgi:ubiquinone/menaquinone biosynthesis C-methylase UbiE